MSRQVRLGLGRSAASALLVVLAVLAPAPAQGSSLPPRVKRNSSINAIAVAPDDRIVVAGTTGNCDDLYECGSLSVAVARYGRGGRLDGSYGNRSFGQVTGVSVSTAAPGELDAPIDLALDRDGSAVVAVQRGTDQGDFPPVLERFDPTGHRDMAFGGTGLAGFFDPTTLSSVAVQGDGKIVALGSFYDRDKQETEIALYRFKPNGQPDADFGVGGVLHTPTPNYGDGTVDLQVLPSGKYLVLGGGGQLGSSYVLRLEQDGTLDPSFGGGDGVATVIERPDDEFGAPSSMAVDGKGRIVVAENESSFYSHGCSSRRVGRLTADGTLDTSFGSGGVVAYRSPFACSGIDSISVLDGGGIVTAGQQGKYAGAPQFALTGLGENGAVDPTFGVDGGVSSPPPRASTQIAGTAVQSNGRLLVAGTAGSRYDECVGGDRKLAGHTCSAFLLLGYRPDGTLDPKFAKDGIALTPRIAVCRLRDASGTLKLTGRHRRARLKLRYRAYSGARVVVSVRGPHDDRRTELFKVSLHKQSHSRQRAYTRKLPGDALARLHHPHGSLRIDLRARHERYYCAQKTALRRVGGPARKRVLRFSTKG